MANETTERLEFEDAPTLGEAAMNAFTRGEAAMRAMASAKGDKEAFTVAMKSHRRAQGNLKDILAKILDYGI